MLSKNVRIVIAVKRIYRSFSRLVALYSNTQEEAEKRTFLFHVHQNRTHA